MTYYQDQTNDNDGVEDMDLDFDLEVNEDDDNYEDIPDQVIFSPDISKLLKTLDINRD